MPQGGTRCRHLIRERASPILSGTLPACIEELLKLGIDTGRPPLASTWRGKAISLGRLYLP
jgi:hypothetical protein